MNHEGKASGDRLRLRLPATSANLGSGFDAVAFALDFHLEVEARRAKQFSITAMGRDAARCSQLDGNLLLDVYQKTLTVAGKPIVPLELQMTNGIPLGMGCGSSAAGRLAGIAMAVHFGGLAWDSDQIIKRATSLEGHPDNVAACWLGGFVACASDGDAVRVARVRPPADWRAIVVLPRTPLATTEARQLLPDIYDRADVVSNLQAAALLGLAFAQQRGDLLKAAMSDRIHQPYRSAICPFLKPLLPLAGRNGILGVALSGAGPAVLVVVEGKGHLQETSRLICAALNGLEEPELLSCCFEDGPASLQEL
jgi:homoserine kinase